MTAPVWLLTLAVGLKTYNLCSGYADLDVPSVAGTLVFRPGLPEYEVEESESGLQDLDVDLDTDAATARDLIFGPVPALGGTCSLRRWYGAERWDEADEWFSGVVGQARVKDGSGGVLLSMYSAEQAPDVGVWPPASAKIDTKTWPPDAAAIYVAPDQSQGRFYPTVFGHPGDGGTGITRGVVPVYVCRIVRDPAGPNALLTALALVGYPRLSTAVVTLTDSQSPGQKDYSCPVASSFATADELGRPVSFCNLLGTDFFTYPEVTVEDLWSEGRYFLMGINKADGYGVSEGGVAVRTAGDVIRWLLRYGGGNLPVDFASIELVRPLLASYQIDTWINEQVKVLDWIQEVIMPFIPARLVRGNKGWKLVYVPPEPVLEEAKFDIVVGGDIQLVEDIDLSENEVANVITVKYGISGWGGGAKQRTVAPKSGILSGEPQGVFQSAIDDDRVLAHHACARSEQLYGVRPLDVDATPIGDDATALLIAQDYADRMALPFAKASINLDAETWEQRLVVGDVVAVTCTTLELERWPMRVESRTIGGAGLRLGLVYRPPGMSLAENRGFN